MHRAVLLPEPDPRHDPHGGEELAVEGDGHLAVAGQPVEHQRLPPGTAARGSRPLPPLERLDAAHHLADQHQVLGVGGHRAVSEVRVDLDDRLVRGLVPVRLPAEHLVLLDLVLPHELLGHPDVGLDLRLAHPLAVVVGVREQLLYALDYPFPI